MTARVHTFAALIAASALIAAPTAFSHTAPAKTNIVNNAKLTEAPKTFTASLESEAGLAKVLLTDGAGKEIALDYTPSRQMGKSFTVPLPSLAAGSYMLAWTMMSKDGHAMDDMVHFTISK